MNEQREQEKNLRIYLQNIPYDDKNKIRNDILTLIKENQSIPCITTGVAKNIDDSYFCYIEVTGIVNIGRQWHEIKIQFPHNYPVAPPQFYILYKPDSYRIQNETTLITANAINLQKNQANETYINIRCPSLNLCWSSEGRNAADAYRQVEIWINNPPLLRKKEDIRRDIIDQVDLDDLKEKFLYEVQLRGLQIQRSVEKCESGQNDIDFNLSRVDFFKRNLPKLVNTIKRFEQKIANKANQLSAISEPIHFERSCDSLLEMDESQKKKLQVMAIRSGLIEGQRKLFKAIEAQMRAKGTKFSDYHSIIRKLSERMFEAQLNFLKQSE